MCKTVALGRFLFLNNHVWLLLGNYRLAGGPFLGLGVTNLNLWLAFLLELFVLLTFRPRLNVCVAWPTHDFLLFLCFLV